MSVLLKPINQQVIFITGATSEVGLATVRMALSRGAKVFMVDRSDDELLQIQTEMRLSNAPTAYAVADVAEIDQIQIAADHCLETFGRIDTWINNAGDSFYGKLLDTSDTEAKRMFDTNFWGVVNGCKIASDLLRMDGGAIINIGCSISEVSLPLQGVYTASKNAVKSYTDSLRSELSAELTPIAVSLVKPGVQGNSHQGENPDIVAEMILKCAVSEIKEIELESPSAFNSFAAKIFPSIKKKINSKFGPPLEIIDPSKVNLPSLTGKVSSSKWITSGLIAGGLTLLLLKRKSFL